MGLVQMYWAQSVTVSLHGIVIQTYHARAHDHTVSAMKVLSGRMTRL